MSREVYTLVIIYITICFQSTTSYRYPTQFKFPYSKYTGNSSTPMFIVGAEYDSSDSSLAKRK